MASIFSSFRYNPPPVPTTPTTPSVNRNQQLSSNEVDYNQNPTKLFKRIEDRAWATTLSRLEKNSNEAKIWVIKRAFDGSTTYKRLPIHQACVKQPTAKIILSLLQSYPNSARQVDSDRRLPIHHACANGASMDVIKHLLMAHPESIKAEDIWFKTPLQTLQNTSNPDPNVVAALKKGPHYYRMKVSEARSRISNKLMPPNSSSSTPSRGRSYSSNNSRDHEIVVKLEEELGRFSERLATSVDQEHVLKNKLHDMDRIQSENQQLRAELQSFGSMQHELDVKNDRISRIELENQNLKEDLNQYRKDLLDFDDVKNSEENLRRQLDKINSGENNRIRELEYNLVNVSDALKEAEARLRDVTNDNERDMFNMKRDLHDAIEDAEAANRQANMYKEEKFSMMKELETFRVLVNSHDGTSNDLKKKLEINKDEKDQLVREMVQLDNHLFSMEKKIKDLTAERDKVVKEKEELAGSMKSLKDMRIEVHDKNAKLEDLQQKADNYKNENVEMKQKLRVLEIQLNEQELSNNITCQNMKRQMESLDDELQRAKKKQATTEDEKEEIEKKVKDQKKINEVLENDIDVLKKKGKDMSTEINGLEKSVQEYRKKWAKEQNETRRLNEVTKDIEGKNIHLQNEVTALTRMKDDLLQKIDELEAELGNQEGDNRSLCRETMSIIAQKDHTEEENEKLRERVESLVKKLEEVEKEKENITVKAEEIGEAKSELDRLHLAHEKLKKAMLEEIEEKEELEAKVGFLLEEVERLEVAKHIPTEINAMVKGSVNNIEQDFYFNEKDALHERIDELEEILQEQNDISPDDKTATSQSIEDLEKRLNLLEESKEKEIRALEDEKIALEKVVSDLNTKLSCRELEIEELTASNHRFSKELENLQGKSSVEKLKKKKSIQERLAAMELRSFSGGGSQRSKVESSPFSLTSPKSSGDVGRLIDDASSQVSGITSVFSSTPTPSPRFSSLLSRSTPRSRFMEAMETRSAMNPGRNSAVSHRGKFDKNWIATYKASKMKDLEGLFPSCMTVTGLSLEGDYDAISATGVRSLKTSPSLALHNNTLKFCGSSVRDRSPLSSARRYQDIRNPSPSSARERILALLEDE